MRAGEKLLCVMEKLEEGVHYKSQLDDKALERSVVHMVLFCATEYGKLNPHDSDSLAAKVQVIYKVPEIKCTSLIFGRQK